MHVLGIALLLPARPQERLPHARAPQANGGHPPARRMQGGPVPPRRRDVGATCRHRRGGAPAAIRCPRRAALRAPPPGHPTCIMARHASSDCGHREAPLWLVECLTGVPCSVERLRRVCRLCTISLAAPCRVSSHRAWKARRSRAPAALLQTSNRGSSRVRTTRCWRPVRSARLRRPRRARTTTPPRGMWRCTTRCRAEPPHHKRRA